MNNEITLKGIILTTPDTRYTPNGTLVCVFKVFDDSKKGEFEVNVWEKLAETNIDFLEKDKNIKVLGRLRFVEWRNREGVDRKKIVVDAIYLKIRK
jgi:single-stranded DNA-binding protein